MEFSYETQGTKTFLVYAVPNEEQLDMVSVGMLVNNRIPGLAQTIFTQMDNTRYVKYNVSAMVPSDQLFMSPISRKRFLGVLNGMICAMLSAEEYMLDPGMIQLDLAHMYSDVRTGETLLICVPVEKGGNMPVDLKDHIKKIMYNTSFDQNENCDYITKIINYLNSSTTLALSDFLEFLHSLDETSGQRVQPAPAAESVPPRREQPSPVPQPGFPQPGGSCPPPAPVSPPPTPVGPPPVPGYPPAAGVQGQPAYQGPAAPFVQPGQKPAPVQIPVAPPPVDPNGAGGAAGDEKPMSLMYLLRHYTKENAEIYKAQQEKSKAAKKEKPAPAAKKSAAKAAKTPAPVGFVVPGGAGAAPEMNGQQGWSAPQPGYTPPAPPQAPPPQPGYTPPAPPQAPPQPAYTPPAQQPYAQPAPQYPSAANFGETSFYSDVDTETETVVLGVQQFPQHQLTPHLVRRKNNERIPVDKPVFRLGRDADFNDYAIGDNRYVGHSHCHLLQQDGEYFVVDDNSKNHTLVNGKAITPGQPVKIAHGYVISVADEEFEFKLY